MACLGREEEGGRLVTLGPLVVLFLFSFSFSSATEGARDGYKSNLAKDTTHLANVCMSIQYVQAATAEWGVPECELNPGKFDCLYCKGFKSYGICSHVLAMNHILQAVNVRRQVAALGTSNRKKAQRGNNMRPLAALTRETRERDSSDEEEEERLALGAGGK